MATIEIDEFDKYDIVRCDFSGGRTCPRCGRTIHNLPAEKLPRVVAVCKVQDTAHLWHHIRVPMGTWIRLALARFGITEKRVSKMLGIKNCGCKRRERALNILVRIPQGKFWHPLPLP